MASIAPRALAAAPYRVGIGRAPDPYDATQRAIDECGEWPTDLIAGRPVIIKPNLVLPQTAEEGGTTSPHVVRALADRALASGATLVVVVEFAWFNAMFTYCGYDFLRTHDPDGRIKLVDLSLAAASLRAVPNGSAYRYLYLPNIVTHPDAVFISAGKLKTHVETGATLSVKNLFGLPPIAPYHDSVEARFRSRFRLHDRGVHQTIVDLALARPVHFAVVDGVWGLEGNSPDAGVPVNAGVAVAGRNAVAVDRVCLEIMATPIAHVQHLAYAAARGLGPSSLSQVQVRGAFAAHPFQQPVIPPGVWAPKSYPAVFSRSSGTGTTLAYRLADSAEVRLEIRRTRDHVSTFDTISVVHDWTPKAAGVEAHHWNGLDDAGAPAPDGTYAIVARTRRSAGEMMSAATGWVTVVA